MSPPCVPTPPQVVLKTGLLAEAEVVTAAELSADLRQPVVTVAAAPRALGRCERARRTAEGWEHVDTGPKPTRRSCRVRGEWAG